MTNNKIYNKFIHKLPNSRMKDAMTVGGIREILAKAEEIERNGGPKIIHLEIGRPDYDSPACAKKAVVEALERGLVHYTDNSGLPELRHAIADSIKQNYGLELDADKEIIVTLGAIEALAVVLFTILEPGDEVIVPSPFFAAYSTQIAMANGVLKEAPCQFENNFHIDINAIEKAITPKTRMILINTPNNPTGASAQYQDLKAIAELAYKYNLLIVSDECYEKFVYDGKHVSFASLINSNANSNNNMPDIRDRVIIIGAASKTFSMTGWRIGWLILPKEIKPYAVKCHQHLTTCATSFAQVGVAEALRNADNDVKRMIYGVDGNDGYKKRRDFFVSQLKNIPGLEVYMPEGAFYVFPRVANLMERFNVTTAEFASWLLTESGVATVPGEAFYAPSGFLRMAYCRPINELSEAINRMKESIQKIW